MAKGAKMVGRKPKPAALKRIEGTYRNDRTRNEPAFAPLHRIDPPRWITDKVARKAWRKLAKMLGGNGLATVADELALGMLVSHGLQLALFGSLYAVYEIDTLSFVLHLAVFPGIALVVRRLEPARVFVRK
ncbi:hypothetical protein ES705_26096 [subsurface metagenome]